MTIRAILDAYDVTESTTLLQLASCHADFKNNRLVVSTQYGFIVSAVAYGWVYGKNALAWRRAAIHDGEATP